MERLPEKPEVLSHGRDFPWSPIAEAVLTVFGCFGLVCAMSLCGWGVGYWIGHMWLTTGIPSWSPLGQWPELWLFTPEVPLAAVVSVVTLHQSLSFPTPRELFKAGAVPLCVWTLATCSIVVRHGTASPYPPKYEGVWAREGAQFNGEFLVEGEAIYVGRDGFVAEVSAPPLSGRRGRARFDGRTDEFVFDLSEDARPSEVVTMKVAVDWEKMRLVMESSDGLKARYTHRRSEVPKWVQEAAR